MVLQRAHIQLTARTTAPQSKPEPPVFEEEATAEDSYGSTLDFFSGFFFPEGV